MSDRPRLPSLREATVLVSCVSLLVACVAESAPGKKKAKRGGFDPDFFDDDYGLEEEPLRPDAVNTDSGAFGAGARPSNRDGGESRTDGGLGDGGVWPKILCPGGLVPGDLAIVELMIVSRSGAGDDGEWVEIQSTRSDCWLKLQGVSIESPRGQAPPNVATITADVELPPGGTFVVAASADPAKNRGLPGDVFAWNAADVLKNDGDTVIVKLGGVVIDQLTYPAFTSLMPGRSLSFPDDCSWNHRADWQRWSLTFDEYAPGFRGTPNGKNHDVVCF
jgi:hypothetical protein